jgi:hypothetical protein
VGSTRADQAMARTRTADQLRPGKAAVNGLVEVFIAVTGWGLPAGAQTHPHHQLARLQIHIIFKRGLTDDYGSHVRAHFGAAPQISESEYPGAMSGGVQTVLRRDCIVLDMWYVHFCKPTNRSSCHPGVPRRRREARESPATASTARVHGRQICAAAASRCRQQPRRQC